MITKIKQLADEALKLQNKNRMDEVLREISAMCEKSQSNISPEKIVIKELMSGKTVLLDGNYVKLTSGEPKVVVNDEPDFKEDEDAIHQMNRALQKGELSKKPKVEKGEKNGK